MINLPAECEGWSKSIDLEKTYKDDDAKNNLKRERYERYKELHDLLSTKDMEGFANQIKTREELIDKMHCFDEFDIDSRISAITKIIDHRDRKIQPLHLLIWCN